MKNFYRDKIVLLTGAAGTVGQELIRQLLHYQPAEIRAMDNNETELFLLSEKYRHTTRVTCFLGDVRDDWKLEKICAGAHIVFHLAALKHVGLSEYNPFDAVQTNILGVKNVIQAAIKNQVERVIFTSSDKAVNPTSVMGTSKLMGERLITSANIVNFNGFQVFSSVRFGNVIGSRGSVVPIFIDQIRRGGPVTVTDPDMTRFFMTVEEAARLVLEACILACGGEVFVTKMPVMRIQDLAEAMIELVAPLYGWDPDDIKIDYIGIRPGEKLYEELMSSEEVSRSQDLKNMFVVLPALRSFYHQIHYRYPPQLQPSEVRRPYISANEKPMAKDQIKDYLLNHQVISEPPALKPPQLTIWKGPESDLLYHYIHSPKPTSLQEGRER